MDIDDLFWKYYFPFMCIIHVFGFIPFFLDKDPSLWIFSVLGVMFAIIRLIQRKYKYS